MTRFIVYAVPEREPIVNYLRHHIPNLEVVWEDGAGAMSTHRRALLHAGEDPIVLMEDDVLLCRDFVQRAEGYVEQYPDTVMTFHSRRGRDLLGTYDISGRPFYNAQMLYLPRGVAARLAAYHPDYQRQEPLSTGLDLLIGEWCYLNDRKIRVVCPNLVDHLPVVSAIRKGRSTKRQSRTFQDPEYQHLPPGILKERQHQ